MGWTGPYYYISRRINGRVVREYFGRGHVAELVAQMDALERKERQHRAVERKAQQDKIKALDEPFEKLNEVGELLARAALVAAGYHRHKRGDWRKKREHGHNCRLQ